MDWAARSLVDVILHEHHGGKQGEHPGCRGHGGQPFSAWEVLVVLAEIPPAWPREDGVDQEANDREHGQRRHPFRLFEPHRTEGGRMLDPAKAGLPGGLLLLIGLEQLGIRTYFRRHRGGQDSPSGSVLGGHHGLWVDHQARAALTRGGLCLGRPPSARALFGNADGRHTIVPGMLTPGAGLAAAPPVAPPVVCRHGRRRVGAPGQPPGFDALAVLRAPRRLLGVGSRVCRRCQPGQLARGHAEQSERPRASWPITLFHRHMAYDTLPTPLPWRLPAGPAGSRHGSGVGKVSYAMWRWKRVMDRLAARRSDCSACPRASWPGRQRRQTRLPTPKRRRGARSTASASKPGGWPGAPTRRRPWRQTTGGATGGAAASPAPGVSMPGTIVWRPAAFPKSARAEGGRPRQRPPRVSAALAWWSTQRPWCPPRTLPDGLSWPPRCRLK